MGYGVIGSPTDSGSVSLGSSPGTPAGSCSQTFGQLPVGLISARGAPPPEIRWRGSLGTPDPRCPPSRDRGVGAGRGRGCCSWLSRVLVPGPQVQGLGSGWDGCGSAWWWALNRPARCRVWCEALQPGTTVVALRNWQYGPARAREFVGRTALKFSAPSSSGPGRRPLKAVAPVRIRSGLRMRDERPRYWGAFSFGAWARWGAGWPAFGVVSRSGEAWPGEGRRQWPRPGAGAPAPGVPGRTRYRRALAAGTAHTPGTWSVMSAPWPRRRSRVFVLA